MERNFAKILILTVTIFLVNGCSKKNEPADLDMSNTEIKQFSLKQFASNKISFTLKGESAEISSGGETSVRSPQLSFSTSKEIIEINTGKEGKGEIKIVPDEKKLTTIVITGNVKIVYRDIETGVVTMEGYCQKLTYYDEQKRLVMEGSPYVTKGKNRFSGDMIFYEFEKNTIEVKGNIDAQIYTEKKPD